MPAADSLSPAQPAIVLVEPQLGENIGATARAMANFGLSDLRIVNPREGWPNPKAEAAASGAPTFGGIRVFPSLPEATADLRFVFAATARPREVEKPVKGPAETARALREFASEGIAAGVMFGRERNGLTNEEVSLADEVLTLPVDPTFPSLNVAQAVLIVAYEWRRAGFADERAALPFRGKDEPPAEKRELLALFDHLEAALDKTGFFRPVEKRPIMVQTLRAMLQRAQFTEPEVRTLRGAVAALERRPTRPYRRADGTITTERGGGE
jgi:tRNA/rRNA methyltransferase